MKYSEGSTYEGVFGYDDIYDSNNKNFKQFHFGLARVETNLLFDQQFNGVFGLLNEQIQTLALLLSQTQESFLVVNELHVLENQVSFKFEIL